MADEYPRALTWLRKGIGVLFAIAATAKFVEPDALAETLWRLGSGNPRAWVPVVYTIGIGELALAYLALAAPFRTRGLLLAALGLFVTLGGALMLLMPDQPCGCVPLGEGAEAWARVLVLGASLLYCLLDFARGLAWPASATVASALFLFVSAAQADDKDLERAVSAFENREQALIGLKCDYRTTSYDKTGVVTAEEVGTASFHLPVERWLRRGASSLSLPSLSVMTGARQLVLTKLPSGNWTGRILPRTDSFSRRRTLGAAYFVANQWATQFLRNKGWRKRAYRAHGSLHLLLWKKGRNMDGSLASRVLVNHWQLDPASDYQPSRYRCVIVDRKIAAETADLVWTGAKTIREESLAYAKVPGAGVLPSRINAFAPSRASPTSTTSTTLKWKRLLGKLRSDLSDPSVFVNGDGVQVTDVTTGESFRTGLWRDQFAGATGDRQLAPVESATVSGWPQQAVRLVGGTLFLGGIAILVLSWRRSRRGAAL